MERSGVRRRRVPPHVPAARPPLLQVVPATVLAVAMAVPLAGCARSPAERACDARSDLVAAVDTTAGHLGAADFGAAGDSLEDVEAALADLVAALADVGGELRDRVEDYLGRVQAELLALGPGANPLLALEALRGLLDEGAVLLDSIARELDCA